MVFPVMGIHQDISETARMEKEKEAERRLAELNDTLRKEKIEQEDYYKELLEMQSCGVLCDIQFPGIRSFI